MESYYFSGVIVSVSLSVCHCQCVIVSVSLSVCHCQCVIVSVSISILDFCRVIRLNCFVTLCYMRDTAFFGIFVVKHFG